MSFLPRQELCELHDLAWTPRWIRRLHTDSLLLFWQLDRYYDHATELLCEALTASKTNHVIDLCSGSGGPLPSIQLSAHRSAAEHTNQIRNFKITLTDLYPNVESWKQICNSSRQQGLPSNLIDFNPNPVDATSCPVSGFRTIFGSYHHFPPLLARKVVENAVKTRSGIAIFEGATRTAYNIFFFFPIFTTFLLAPLVTPFIRPFSFFRLFFTYVIPVALFMHLVDGTVSCLRSYTHNEFKELIRDIPGVQDYEWKIGTKSIWKGPNLNYFIGYPKIKVK